MSSNSWKKSGTSSVEVNLQDKENLNIHLLHLIVSQVKRDLKVM